MAPQNSQINFYVELLSEMLFDTPQLTISARSIQRDVQTLKSRASSEGLGFLTKTLPKLGKALDQGLTSMRFTIPNGFKAAKDMNIPAFLQECFKRIFDRDGWLLADADPASVSYIRQICFFLYKLELPYSVKDEARVIGSFLLTEEELKLSDDTYSSENLRGAAYIIRDALYDFNHEDIIPRHGPGAVSTGERLDQKWVFSRFYTRLNSVYPYHEYFMVGGDREAVDRLDWLNSLRQLETGCAKVVLVPKDSRGPRLISAEPLEYQFIQQGLGRKLMRHLETSRFTRGRVNFTDQEINRSLALSSSKTGEFATLDLKDASDRVSLGLVRSLFRHLPELLAALEATRTTETKLPEKWGNTIVPLAKFAPMGSALCFPVEAICFWAICVSAISRWARLRPAEAGKGVYVYGDDIIVHTEYAATCIHALEAAGLKVNRDKSCISGEFRESCGTDAFRGVCVTPTRLRTPWSGRRTDSASYVSYHACANSLAQKGYASSADFIWKSLKRVYGKVPYGTATSPYPCRIVESPEVAEKLNFSAGFKTRFNRTLHRFEFFVLKTKTRKQSVKIDGWSRLLRGVLTSFLDSDPAVNVVPRSLRIKRGWAPV